MAATPSTTSPFHHMASAPLREDMELSGSSGSGQRILVGPAGGAHDAFQQRELKNDLGCCKLLCPSALSCCLACFFPCAVCPHQVNPRSESVLITYGKYIGTLREPGLYCLNGCGTMATKVNTAVSATDLPQLKVLDSKGNPLRVSGVVMWEVLDSKVAVLDVQQYANFLRSQAEVVMKQICSMHPYDELKVRRGHIGQTGALLGTKSRTHVCPVLLFSFLGGDRQNCCGYHPPASKESTLNRHAMTTGHQMEKCSALMSIVC